MDAMGVDYTCLFPTGMLSMGHSPQIEIERDLSWAYSRWLTEKVIPESGGRLCSCLPLPFGSPAACLRAVETFGDRKGVVGFMVTTVRHQPVYDDDYMRTYRAIEERGLTLSFHAGNNWGEQVFKSCNRFITVHALGFSFYNMLHLSNWVVNGMGERFPNLPVIWIESGLAWLPFLMQRLDHEYMLRSSECPLLKKKPSDYMRDMYYSSQPMEREDMTLLEQTLRVIDAEDHLLYSSDYPHWDFDLPSTIYDLPFLSERGKHNILGGTAARLFKLPPRNEKQRENMIKYGNLAA
jgi:predicted TIM-barrel fold metal-dependent hydrolase